MLFFLLTSALLLLRLSCIVAWTVHRISPENASLGEMIHDAATSRNTTHLANLLHHASPEDFQFVKETSGNVIYGNPLVSAAYQGYTEVVDMLLAAGAEVNQNLPSGNISALGAAANKGWNVSTVELLLQKGADVNAPSWHNQTALMLASRRDNTAIVEVLLANGANPNQAGLAGRTALMYAASYGRGDADTVCALLNAGAEVNAKDKSGVTALHSTLDWFNDYHTSVRERGPLIEALLEAGADVNAQDEDGRSALMYAVGGCYKANVERLLWAGADFSLQDKHGCGVAESPDSVAAQEWGLPAPPTCGTRGANFAISCEGPVPWRYTEDCTPSTLLEM